MSHNISTYKCRLELEQSQVTAAGTGESKTGTIADRGVDHPPVELGHLRKSLPMTFRETAERTPGRHNQCTRKAPRMMQASVLAVVVCCTLAALVGTLVPALRRGPGALPDASHRLQGASRRRPRPGSSAPGSSPAWPLPTCTSQWPACARPGKRTACTLQWSALLSLLWWSQVRQRHANDVTQERLHGTQRIRSMLKLLPQVSLVVAVAPLQRNRPTGPCGACAASPDDSALCDGTKCQAAR